MSAASSPSADVVDPAVVTRLLGEQFPHLAGLPVRTPSASGSSNWVFRLGDHLAVRLPRSDGYAEDLLKEAWWLPRFAPAMSTPVPEVVAVGEASEAFPRPWAIVTWLPGQTPDRLDLPEQLRLAETLGGFLRDLHGMGSGDLPAGPSSSYRCGEPVTDTMDEWLEQAALALADLYDPGRVRAAWRRLREVPPASSDPCWVHTDLAGENMLVHDDGRLAGVIDFGGIGVGDRSVDLLYAWSLFAAPARAVLGSAAQVDDADWARARAWAFVGPGLMTIADYRHTMPARTQRLCAMVEAVAAEVGIALR